MATDDFIYLNFDEAVWLHFELIWDRGDLIESALARPKQAAFYANADIISQAATLCFGLVKNHPRRGGNKRTATYLMRVFLFINGFDLEYEIEDILEMVLAVESDEWKITEIENWLRSRVRKI